MTAKGIATETLGPLLHGAVPEHAATSPAAVAVIDATGAMSYAELDEAARCFANELTSRGVSPRRGGSPSTSAPSVELTIAMLSTLRIGATDRADRSGCSRALASPGRRGRAKPRPSSAAGLIVEWHSNECVDPKQPRAARLSRPVAEPLRIRLP